MVGPPAIEHNVYGEKNVQQIPVIDLSAARVGGLASRQAVAREIDATCREIGFFTITGHGVPVATMDQLRSKAHAFFALPLEEKRNAIHSVAGTPRGYRAQGLEGAGAYESRHDDAARPQGVLSFRPRKLAKRAVLYGARRPELFHTESVAAQAGGLCGCGSSLLCGNGEAGRVHAATHRTCAQHRRAFFRRQD